MNPNDPLHAQQIVTEYSRVLEQHLENETFPAPLHSLPHPKPVIRTAILTCVQQLTVSEQLSEDLKDFLETAYVSLADYLDAELVRLLKEYRESAQALTTLAGAPRDRQKSPVWERVHSSSRLAGEIARSMADEAEALRREFHAVLQDSSTPQ